MFLFLHKINKQRSSESWKAEMKWIVCTGLKKYIGLMFRWKSPNLLFIFDKESHQPIHSFFCRTFKATWYDYDGTIIYSRIVKPFLWDVKPPRPYWFLSEERI